MRVKRASGTIKKLPSGRFIAKLPRSIRADQPNIQPSRSFATHEEAERALEEEMVKIRMGLVRVAQPTTVAADDRTVAAVTQRFIDESASGPDALQPTTLRGYRSDRRAVVCHPDYGLGDKIVDELTAAEVVEWRDQTLPAAGVTRHMISGGMRFLSSALSWDVERGALAGNPILGLRRRRRATTVAAQSRAVRVVVPTWEQEMNLVLAVEDEQDRLMLLTLMRSGARFSEVASLPPEQLGADGHGAYAAGAWKRRSKEDSRNGKVVWEQQPLKGGLPRNLFLPAPLFVALVGWRDQRRVAPARGRKNVIFPFVGRSGIVRNGAGVWEATDWREQVIVPARTAAGLPALKTKDLRMAAASNFHDAGFSDAQIQELLGHEPGSAVTRRHYVRPVQDVHSGRREAIRTDPTMGPQQRLDALWDAWVEATGADPLCAECSKVLAAAPLPQRVLLPLVWHQHPKARRRAFTRVDDPLLVHTFAASQQLTVPADVGA